MPEIGEIQRLNHRTHIWHACEDCGRERWARCKKGQSANQRCRSCNARNRGISMRGEGHPAWKGGRVKQSVGYIKVRVFSDDFFYSMVDKKGYVLEHRLVMAKHLGRCLQRWEIVHHKSGIKDDNGLENLQLVSDERHNQITILENRIKYLEGGLMRATLKNSKIIGCPVCWGLKVVCVGLKDNLEPILEPCTGCDGTGWLTYKEVDKKEKSK
ncbi:hypothetical protein LCGC14_0384890 [marine sediment metagenome]|uniref:HNH nuclease domain-containing protein n=1 Tax=marine sediment metagenome TaxID=412755 RepID=A0A0F9TJA6_9ZZZZ